MPLVPAKCTNCGANLQVDNTKDAAVCPYCGTPYIVEKAINKYNVTNHVTNNIHADVANFYGDSSADFVIRAGELLKYNGAATDVVIPNSVISIYHEAFAGCDLLNSVVIPSSVTSYRFYRCCPNKVVFLDGVTSICARGFDDCISLDSVVIPNSVESIGARAFAGCARLTSVAIPNNIRSIDDNAFSDCTSLKSVTIQADRLTSIGNNAFSGCTNLESVTIQANRLISIGNDAFRGCTSLKNVTIQSKTECLSRIGEYAFGFCTSLREVTLPNSDIKIFNNTFHGCDSLTTINASEDWKRKNAAYAACLRKDYTPPEPCACYVATAVYGSYDCPQVWTLRRFRDNELAATWYGRAFIRCYYAVSPTLVKWFGKTRWFQSFWKKRLDRLVRRLNAEGTEDTPYQDKIW